ncbi:hypothetical protein C6N75_09805 [Streptomyces solincola]|uniref:Uncharacterized protein n=1 Tax=Streptomyces solincola TaxID=2100817 RepID=A0A2S9PY81_9ACTN|nr:hypothetical protein [Streptomyces solincola]PRH79369.1 hypothetical protein C6N75_09805 [Streptomyces solincola]
MNKETTDRARQLLIKARNILETNGWHQGAYAANLGGRAAVCALGALNMASTDVSAFTHYDSDWVPMLSAQVRLAKAAGLGGFARERIPAWNDDPRTTAEDVLLAFKKAAEL